MANMLVSNRIKFSKKGLQKEFISDAKTSLKETNLSLAKKLKINPRTLADWTREKFNMSYESAKLISKLSHLPIPKDHTMIEWHDHLKKISYWGGKSVVLKYGRVPRNEMTRKAKWREWWDKSGKYNKNIIKIQTSKDIISPGKNLMLAEFVGIMLGDGNISEYVVKITLSSLEQKYGQYILILVRDLFGVKATVRKLKNVKAINILVQRKQLVDFCLQIGLVKGNKVKHQVDIPEWVKASRKFSRVCVRGLMDTDGCFYYNSYSINKKKYSYLKITFKNSSVPLLRSVNVILSNLGIKSQVNKNLKDVRISDSESVKKYIQEIGTKNQKHLKRIISTQMD